MRTVSRKIREIGWSHTIALPRAFVRENNLKAGQTITLGYEGKTLILLSPEDLENLEEPEKESK